MKKNQCIHCNDQTCRECSRPGVKLNGVNINPDLYAAEFILYAFHFQQETSQKKSNTSSRTIPLGILASEG
jgi:hypothetical protein